MKIWIKNQQQINNKDISWLIFYHNTYRLNRKIQKTEKDENNQIKLG